MAILAADYPVLAESLSRTGASEDATATLNSLITAANSLYSDEAKARLSVTAEGYALIAEYFMAKPATDKMLEETITYNTTQHAYWLARANEARLALTGGAQAQTSTSIPVEVHI